VWAKTHADPEMPKDLLDSIKAPKDLLKAIQEWLITCWWTIGSLAIGTNKHLKFFLLLAKGVCNMTKTINKDNAIASNLLPLASSKWIVGNVLFITGITKSWLNPQMKFYQGMDPNIREPGFLSFHCQVCFFLMIKDIDKMKNNWQANNAFSKFSTKVEEMSNKKLHKLKLAMVSTFLSKMQKPVQKHNKHYLLTRNLVCSVFLEWQMGQAIAQFLKGGKPSLSAPFFYELHGQEINCEKFFKFMQDKVPLVILEQLHSEDPAVIFQQDAIEEIAVSGLDIFEQIKHEHTPKLSPFLPTSPPIICCSGFYIAHQ
jgi:hypothetical protein